MRFLCLSAVQTIEKANALAEVNATRDIFIASVYQVTEKENWDLGGKIIHRYKLDGYMIELKDASASILSGMWEKPTTIAWAKAARSAIRLMLTKTH